MPPGALFPSNDLPIEVEGHAVGLAFVAKIPNHGDAGPLLRRERLGRYQPITPTADDPVKRDQSVRLKGQNPRGPIAAHPNDLGLAQFHRGGFDPLAHGVLQMVQHQIVSGCQNTARGVHLNGRAELPGNIMERFVAGGQIVAGRPVVADHR